MKPIIMDPNQMTRMFDPTRMTEMLDRNRMMQQMTECQRAAIDTSFNTLEIMQGRMEKVMRMFWDQTAWSSDRMGGVFLDWTRNYQDGCEAVQRVVENQMGRFGCAPKAANE